MLDRLLGGISQSLSIVAGCFVLAMMGHICADVFFRFVVGRSLQGTVEVVSAYYMVGVIFLPLMQVTRERDHIAADLVTRTLSLSAQARLNIVTSAVGLIFLAWFSYQSIVAALHRTRRGEVWESGAATLTVWPSRWVLAIGLSLMTVQFAVLLLIDLRNLRGPQRPSEEA